MIEPPPQQFLAVRVEVSHEVPTFLGLCASYEMGKWRSEQFAGYLRKQLIQFIYPVEEWGNVNSATAEEMLRKAAIAVYTTDKYQKRGEIGELILFAIMRSHYNSIPFVSKFYFKNASNDTVKGFDGVHIVKGDVGFELWLGEAKFYTDAASAIRDAIQSITRFTEADYLRKEFMWIENKMRAMPSGLDDVRRLLDENRSLDEVFPTLHIPVLITYESLAVQSHTRVTDDFQQAISAELTGHFNKFKEKCRVKEISVHLIAVPLHSKKELQDHFDRKLKGAQA
ncbi:MAG: DUF1837 domain-containing protein [Magnetococcales bacterium]|nr:DUF1837 domain-containing protein [Magnetococcales bacterium]